MSHHFLPLLAAGLLLGTVATAQTLPGDSVRDYSLDEFVVTGTGTLRLKSIDGISPERICESGA